MNRAFITIVFYCLSMQAVIAQQQLTPDEEVWSPEPSVVIAGKAPGSPPSDAIILFDGTDLSAWASARDTTAPAKWKVNHGVITVDKKEGDIQTRQKFTDYQLHIEWKILSNITGKGQSRGNSGVILASTALYDFGYEVQVLDSYRQKTYVNGQAGAIYKQYIPLVNASKQPGEWQWYDIVWQAPRWNHDGTLQQPAGITVFHNGVLIQNHVLLRTPSSYKPDKNNPASPVKLQAHGDPSEPVSFRNIWIRPL
ncbi:MAG: DUF1080 domain-containing protein [Chitinophagaceae bacterium]|nr:DUF1080 domain-containing protein [Chitinophagaceae bacterium]